MNISIIVCTYNRAAHLRETLLAIEQLEIPAELRAELILVDNGSSDNTRQVAHEGIVKRMPTKYLFESRAGQSYARNAGMSAASGDVILFADDDILPPVEWIPGMCKPILSGEADAVAGSARLNNTSLRNCVPDEILKWFEWDFSNIPSPGTLVGGNMAFSRHVLDKVPEFDPQLGPGALGFGDDTLFAMQLEASGFKIANAGPVFVRHNFDEDRLKWPALVARAVGAGRAWAYIHHHWLHSTFKALRARALCFSVLRATTRFASIPTSKSELAKRARELHFTTMATLYADLRSLSSVPRKYMRQGMNASKSMG